MNTISRRQLISAGLLGLAGLTLFPKPLFAQYPSTGTLRDVAEEFRRKHNLSHDRMAEFHWVRGVGAYGDKVNPNGCVMPSDELKAAYKTFEGVPVYPKCSSGAEGIGMGNVVRADWDNDNNLVLVSFFIDRAAYPDISRLIQHGYTRNISYCATVEHSQCSVCDNDTIKFESEHIKNLWRDYDPSCGVCETLYGLKFTEIFLTSDETNCQITDQYIAE